MQELYDYADGSLSQRITYLKEQEEVEGGRTVEYFALGDIQNPTKVERYDAQNNLLGVEEYTGEVLRRRQTMAPGTRFGREEKDAFLAGTLDSVVEHDAQGRVTAEKTVLPGLTVEHIFTYDANGKLIQMTSEKTQGTTADAASVARTLEKTVVDYDTAGRAILLAQTAPDVNRPGALATSVFTYVYNGDSDLPTQELWDFDNDGTQDFQRSPGGDWEAIPDLVPPPPPPAPAPAPAPQ